MRTAQERKAEAARHQQMTEAVVRPLKVTVVLHTNEGPVRTAYGPNCEQHATSLVLQYLQDGKNFTVEQSFW